MSPNWRKSPTCVKTFNAEQAAEPWARRLADALGEAMPNLEPQNRWDVFEQIQRLMKGYGHDAAADELARHLG